MLFTQFCNTNLPISEVSRSVPFSSNFRIGVKFESYIKLPHLKQVQNNNLNPLYLASNLGLNPRCFILKKKNKILLTTLSSPHVHKKSREQFKIDYYKTYFFCDLSDLSDLNKFLKFKIKLYATSLEQGLVVVITYKKNFMFKGFLPNLKLNF